MGRGEPGFLKVVGLEGGPDLSLALWELRGGCRDPTRELQDPFALEGQLVVRNALHSTPELLILAVRFVALLEAP